MVEQVWRGWAESDTFWGYFPMGFLWKWGAAILPTYDWLFQSLVLCFRHVDSELWFVLD